LVPPRAADTLFIDKPAAGQNRVSGYSNTTALSPLTFFNVSQVLIDTAANDGGGGDDSITISSDGMVAAGLTALSVDAGTGANTLATYGGTTPLFAINGGLLAVSGDNDAVVNLVASQTLGSLTLSDTARAILPS